MTLQIKHIIQVLAGKKSNRIALEKDLGSMPVTSDKLYLFTALTSEK